MKSIARLFESVRIWDKVDCNRVSIYDKNEELDYLREKVRRLEYNRQGGSWQQEKGGRRWGIISWEGNGWYDGWRSGGVARGYGQRGSRCNVCGGSGIALDGVRRVI